MHKMHKLRLILKHWFVQTYKLTFIQSKTLSFISFSLGPLAERQDAFIPAFISRSCCRSSRNGGRSEYHSDSICHVFMEYLLSMLLYFCLLALPDLAPHVNLKPDEIIQQQTACQVASSLLAEPPDSVS